MFSVIEQVLLRPLPYRDASRLVLIAPHPSTTAPSTPPLSPTSATGNPAPMSSPKWPGGPSSPHLRNRDSATLVAQISASPNLLDVLGAQPYLAAASSLTTPSGFDPGFILGDSTWHKVFNANKSAIVEPRHQREQYTIVGVMPPNFEFPQGTGDEIYSPLPYDRSFEDRASSSSPPSLACARRHRRPGAAGNLRPPRAAPARLRRNRISRARRVESLRDGRH